jgi:ABC-type multidrug transport system fused ATPase/permease subunit
MTGNNHAFGEEELFEYSQLIEGLPKITSLENPNNSDFTETEGKIDPEVEEVFNLLLKWVIIHPKADTSNPRLSRQPSNLWEKIAPTFWMQLSLIGAVFFFFAAVVAKLINPILIEPVAIYFFIFFCFSLLFVLMWEIRWIRHSKSSKQEAEESFQKAIEEAVIYDWQTINDIVKVANYKKKVLQYIENKFQAIIEKQQDNMKVVDKFLPIGGIFIVAIGIYFFGVFLGLVSNTLSGNILIWSAKVAVLSAVVSVIVLVFGFIFDSRNKIKLSSYRNCVYLLKQAQLLEKTK